MTRIDHTGHERYASGECATCSRARAYAWNLAHPEIAAARQKAARSPEGDKARLQAWRRDNPDKYLAQQARGRAGGAGASRTAKHRAARLQATPPWQQRRELDGFYAMSDRVSACLGIQHHVDHIHPLQGVRSRGLHVPWNLRVIPAKVNIAKGNRVDTNYATNNAGSGV